MVCIYVEKHSPAKAIATALNAGKRKPLKGNPEVGYWEFTFKNEKAFIVYGRGHIVRLLTPQEYDSKYKKWDLDTFPCIPQKYELAPIEDTLPYYNLVKKIFDKCDWIINATDADREGELIFNYVYTMLGKDKLWKRAWLPNDLTATKIVKAFNNLRSAEDMFPLICSARIRSSLDWIYGMNFSVASTVKFSTPEIGVLSYGRVQTPTLNMIVEREKLIRSHEKLPIWKLSSEFSYNNETYKGEYVEGYIKSEDKSIELFDKVNNNKGTVKSINKITKKNQRPLLYNSTKLQSACNKKFGWDTQKTEKIMQKLYDEYHCLSYPRTESEYITEEMKDEVRNILLKLFSTTLFSKYALPENKWQPFSNRHFNNKKVAEAHTAIMPTLTIPDFSKMTSDEIALYEFVCKTLISIVYEDISISETIVITSVNGVEFKTIGKEVLNPNTSWLKLSALNYNNSIPINLAVNDVVVAKPILNKGETKPPARYTEGSLLTAMETAGKLIKDEEARTLMRIEKKGLGTGGTRPAIIKSLKTHGLIKNVGKSIVPTEKGIYLIDSLPIPDLKSAELTGELEKRLGKIANCMGNENAKSMYIDFTKDINVNVVTYFNKIKTCNSELSKPILLDTCNSSNAICPKCKKPLRFFDWGVGCSGYKEGCSFSLSKNIAQKKLTTNQLLSLINKGKTKEIKGFTKKDGTKFSAILMLDENFKIKFMSKR